MTRENVMAGSSWDPSYPTSEQATAAAFAASSVGEEVAVHTSDCALGKLTEHAECDCTPAVYVRRESGWVPA